MVRMRTGHGQETHCMKILEEEDVVAEVAVYSTNSGCQGQSIFNINTKSIKIDSLYGHNAIVI